MIVASSDRMVIMTHQNLTAGICFEPPWKVSSIFWDCVIKRDKVMRVISQSIKSTEGDGYEA